MASPYLPSSGGHLGDNGADGSRMAAKAKAKALFEMMEARRHNAMTLPHVFYSKPSDEVLPGTPKSFERFLTLPQVDEYRDAIYGIFQNLPLVEYSPISLGLRVAILLGDTNLGFLLALNRVTVKMLTKRVLDLPIVPPPTANVERFFTKMLTVSATKALLHRLATADDVSKLDNERFLSLVAHDFVVDNKEEAADVYGDLSFLDEPTLDNAIHSDIVALTLPSEPSLPIAPVAKRNGGGGKKKAETAPHPGLVAAFGHDEAVNIVAARKALMTAASSADEANAAAAAQLTKTKKAKKRERAEAAKTDEDGGAAATLEDGSSAVAASLADDDKAAPPPLNAQLIKKLAPYTDNKRCCVIQGCTKVQTEGAGKDNKGVLSSDTPQFKEYGIVRMVCRAHKNLSRKERPAHGTVCVVCNKTLLNDDGTPLTDEPMINPVVNPADTYYFHTDISTQSNAPQQPAKLPIVLCGTCAVIGQGMAEQFAINGYLTNIKPDDDGHVSFRISRVNPSAAAAAAPKTSRKKPATTTAMAANSVPLTLPAPVPSPSPMDQDGLAPPPVPVATPKKAPATPLKAKPSPQAVMVAKSVTAAAAAAAPASSSLEDVLSDAFNQLPLSSTHTNASATTVEAQAQADAEAEADADADADEAAQLAIASADTFADLDQFLD